MDDLNALADLCEKEDLWVHVDGAIGAVAVLAENVKPQLQGIERADSRQGTSGSTTMAYNSQVNSVHSKCGCPIKEHGLDRFGRMNARNVEQAHYFGQLVEKEPLLEILAPIGMDIICFRFNPGGMDEDALNTLNKEIIMQLHEKGIAAPSYTTLEGRYCLRIAISNHRSTFEDFDLLASEVVHLGKEIVAQG